MNRFVDAAAQARSLKETAHRPRPVKDEPWLMGQTWESPLSSHWHVPHDDLRAHAPWPLQRADATVEEYGISPVPLEGEPLCHLARRQDVVVWKPERV